MNQKHRKKKRPFFSPDDISTRISQALKRDLDSATQVYGGLTPPLKEAVDIQGRDLLKKYISESCSISTLSSDCYAKFREVNSHMLEANIRFLECSSWASTWLQRDNIHPKASVIQKNMPFEQKVLFRARSLMKHTLGSWSIDELFHACKHSGGSSVGVPFTDTSLERKFQCPMSATSEVASLMDIYLTFDSSMKAAVDESRSNLPLQGRYSLVEGSRATTVRKTALKDRMIAVEPTVNMFFQQGLMAMVYKRMSKVNLNVESLPNTHKRLAQKASVDGRNATIDWSNASDCVSIELLRFLLPPKWFDIIERVRSPSIEIDGSWEETHMISTMGNAVTFPLETLVFWTIGKAIFHTLTRQSNWLVWSSEEAASTEISVFGDDCIVPTWMADDYMSTLTKLGFIVNKEKSFYGTETFRESCGGDYRAGYNVRPFCLKAPTSRGKSALEPWLNIIINALIPKYISYFGTLSWCYDRELFKLLVSIVEEYKLNLRLVPHDFPDDAGIKISFDLERFLGSYPSLIPHMSKLSVNNHGQVSFLYNHFRYFEEASARNARIRLADRLRKPYMPRVPEVRAVNMERRGGSYVVAKALTAHWVVPFVRARRSA